jgi:hypothetical protein
MEENEIYMYKEREREKRMRKRGKLRAKVDGSVGVLKSLDIRSRKPMRCVEAIGTPFSHEEFISNLFALL